MMMKVMQMVMMKRKNGKIVKVKILILILLFGMQIIYNLIIKLYTCTGIIV